MGTDMLMKETSVKRVVDNWFAKLDVHASVEELLPMLTTEGLEMRFPEGTLHSTDEFMKWYETVTHRFFDEVHTMKELHIHVSSDHADVQLVVNWQAHIWNPPTPKSSWLGFDAAQRWVVKPAPGSQNLVIATYIVDSLTPMPGSARL